VPAEISGKAESGDTGGLTCDPGIVWRCVYSKGRVSLPPRMHPITAARTQNPRGRRAPLFCLRAELLALTKFRSPLLSWRVYPVMLPAAFVHPGPAGMANGSSHRCVYRSSQFPLEGALWKSPSAMQCGSWGSIHSQFLGHFHPALLKLPSPYNRPSIICLCLYFRPRTWT
jgi:hypothetical protein